RPRRVRRCRRRSAASPSILGGHALPRTHKTHPCPRAESTARESPVLVTLGACLSIPREPLRFSEGADARRAAQAVVSATAKPRNTADAPPPANPSYPCRHLVRHRDDGHVLWPTLH